MWANRPRDSVAFTSSGLLRLPWKHAKWSNPRLQPSLRQNRTFCGTSCWVSSGLQWMAPQLRLVTGPGMSDASRQPFWQRASAISGWAVAVAAMLAGVPIFLRMPPWCDVTLYDVAARNLLSGGVLYRDVFDTNMPGFVWALGGVRLLSGWSYEALRTVDLLVVAGIALLIDRLAQRAGASRSARAWTVAGIAAFYLFTCEFNHCQRDVWLTLPALAAVSLR